MGARWRRFAGLAAIVAGLALIVGSFLPWEHSFGPRSGASSHSGLDCVCGGELTVALGVILMGMGGAALAGALAWLPTTILSIFAGWLVALLRVDVADDSFTVAVGIGVYVMAAGAAFGLVGGILMLASRPKRRPEAESAIGLAVGTLGFGFAYWVTYLDLLLPIGVLFGFVSLYLILRRDRSRLRWSAEASR